MRGKYRDEFFGHMWATIASGAAAASIQGRPSPQEVADQADAIMKEFLKRYPQYDRSDEEER